RRANLGGVRIWKRLDVLLHLARVSQKRKRAEQARHIGSIERLVGITARAYEALRPVHTRDAFSRKSRSASVSPQILIAVNAIAVPTTTRSPSETIAAISPLTHSLTCGSAHICHLTSCIHSSAVRALKTIETVPCLISWRCITG